MIAPPSMSAVRRTASLPEAADSPFDTPWCLAAMEAGLAPWFYDVATDRLHWSHALHAGLGYPALPSAPTVRWWMSQVHPDDAEHAAHTYDAVGAGTITTWSLPYRLRRADGSWAPVVDVGHATRDVTGKLAQLAGYVLFR